MQGSVNGINSPVAEGHPRARVVGRRVQVTSEVDYGEKGVVVDVRGAELVVTLDRAPDMRMYFTRSELVAA